MNKVYNPTPDDGVMLNEQFVGGKLIVNLSVAVEGIIKAGL